MKITLSVILIAMLALSFNAQAAMWRLVGQQYMNSYYLCTYQNGQYQRTIQSQFYCQSYIMD